MFSETRNPHAKVGVLGPVGDRAIAGGGSLVSLPPSARAVKLGNSDPARLAGQALANEERAASMAAWHRERAGRYLAWHDMPWAAAQFEHHTAEAAYFDAVAAHHRAVRAAMGQVRP